VRIFVDDYLNFQNVFWHKKTGDAAGFSLVKVG